MGTVLITLGVVCVLGAIVGGGLKALGTELPALQSITRQTMLALFGLILIVFGAVGNQTGSSPQGNQTATKVDVAPDAPIVTPALLANSSTCLAGDWLEALKGRPDDASPNRWSFEPTGDTLTITRADNFIKGAFTRSGASWEGTLTFGNGDVWKDVSLTPSADCKVVQTNQQWYYRR